LNLFLYHVVCVCPLKPQADEDFNEYNQHQQQEYVENQHQQQEYVENRYENTGKLLIRRCLDLCKQPQVPNRCSALSRFWTQGFCVIVFIYIHLAFNNSKTR
jgi:hypothetical protein